jgi:hypothetical protein
MIGVDIYQEKTFSICDGTDNIHQTICEEQAVHEGYLMHPEWHLIESSKGIRTILVPTGNTRRFEIRRWCRSVIIDLPTYSRYEVLPYGVHYRRGKPMTGIVAQTPNTFIA